MTSLTNEQRKKLLQLNSEIARMEIESARIDMQTSLDHRVLLRRLTGQAGSALGSALGVSAGIGSLKGMNANTVQQILPYASTIFGFVRKRSLKHNLFLGAAAFGVALLARKYLGGAPGNNDVG